MPDWVTLLFLTALFVAIIAESRQTGPAAVAGEYIKLCAVLCAILFIVVVQVHNHPAAAHREKTILASCDIPHICQGAKSTRTVTP